MTDMQIAQFDYQQLDTETRIAIQQRTGEIKALMKRTAQDIIEIGQKLIEVKERLGHGGFGAWLETEFGWGTTTAWRFMNVAEKFSNLENLPNFAPSTLYLLAEPSTPDEARREVIDRAQTGERITHTKAKEIVRSHQNIDDIPPHPDPFIDRWRHYDTIEEYMDTLTQEEWEEAKRRAAPSTPIIEPNKTPIDRFVNHEMTHEEFRDFLKANKHLAFPDEETDQAAYEELIDSLTEQQLEEMYPARKRQPDQPRPYAPQHATAARFESTVAFQQGDSQPEELARRDRERFEQVSEAIRNLKMLSTVDQLGQAIRKQYGPQERVILIRILQD